MKLYKLFSLSEKNAVITAYTVLAALLTAGLFIPLMDNDAGEYALIALNMSQKNDFVNIIRKGQDYLDSHIYYSGYQQFHLRFSAYTAGRINYHH